MIKAINSYLAMYIRLSETKRRLISTSVFLVVGALSILLGYSTVKFAVSIKQAKSSLELIAAATVVKTSLIDAETGQRGFIITGNEDYLDPYYKTKADLDAQLRTLDMAMRQREMVNSSKIEAMAHTKMDELAKVIEIRRNQGFEPARDYVLLNIGRQLMHDIRSLIDQIRDEETKAILAATKFTRQILQAMVYEMTILLFGLLALILVPWGFTPRKS